MPCLNLGAFRCNAWVVLLGCLTLIRFDDVSGASTILHHRPESDEDSWERVKRELVPAATPGADRSLIVDETPPVEEAFFRHGGISVRGLAASRTLKKGDIIVDAPTRWVLRVDHPDVRGLFGTAGLPRHGDEVFAIACFLATERRLAAMIAEQKEEDKHVTTADGHLRRTRDPDFEFAPSPWAPYIRSLPSLAELQEFHPLYARPELLDVFADLPAASRVLKHQERLEQNWRLWRTIEPRIKPLREGRADVVARQAAARHVTQEDLTWGTSIVISRGFTSLSGSPELVPLVDEINMDLPSSKNVRWFQRFDGSFRAYATSDVPRGKELFFDYIFGEVNASNSNLVSSYGFSLAGYPSKAQHLGEAKCHEVAQRAEGAAKRSGVSGPSTLCDKGAAPSKQEAEPQLPIFCLLWRLAEEQCPEISSDKGAAAAAAEQDAAARRLRTTTARPKLTTTITTTTTTTTTTAATTTTTTTFTTTPLVTTSTTTEPATTTTTTSSTTTTTTTIPTTSTTTAMPTAASTTASTTISTTSSTSTTSTTTTARMTTAAPTTTMSATTSTSTTTPVSTKDVVESIENEVSGEVATVAPSVPTVAPRETAVKAHQAPTANPLPTSSTRPTSRSEVHLDKAQEDLLRAISR